MKVPDVILEAIQRMGVMIALLLVSSCNSLPIGIAPEGPIIITADDNSSTDVMSKYEDGEDAVNYMITALVTSCTPIASASNNALVEVLNSFTVSHGDVNGLPLEVWQKLIRMKMIKPVSNPDSQYDYSLVSEIEEIPNPDSDKKRYLWKMRFLQNDSEKKEVWRASFEFIEKEK